MRRVFAADEARFGLKVKHRRHWSPFGCRPPWSHDDQYQWLWLYAAVEPATGQSLVLFLPRVDGGCFEAFLGQLRAAVPEAEIALVLDNSGAHKSARVHWPPGIHKVALPPYSPELNPAERWFEVLRKEMADRVFESLAEMEAALTDVLRPFWDEPDCLKRLTGYPWWRKAVASLL